MRGFDDVEIAKDTTLVKRQIQLLRADKPRRGDGRNA
jgi:hypothetical protein